MLRFAGMLRNERLYFGVSALCGLFWPLLGTLLHPFGRRLKRAEENRSDGGLRFLVIRLDEIGDIGPSIQTKLLRVIQEHEFERVGGNKTISVDVRIVAATNKKLEDLVKDGNFREDLYYRLNVVNINVPPLRSRREDVEPLSRFFLEKYTAETGKKITDLSPRALSCLLAHDWPGNVRELQNAIERAVVLSKGSVLTPRDFPQGMQGDDQICLQIPEKGGSLTDILEDLERQLIIQTLQREEGSQTRAAETLGIKRTTLRYKMEKYRMID